MKTLSKRKSTCWLIAVAIVLLCCQKGAGEIINAYECDLKLITLSINNLETLILSPQTPEGAKGGLIEKLT